MKPKSIKGTGRPGPRAIQEKLAKNAVSEPVLGDGTNPGDIYIGTLRKDPFGIANIEGDGREIWIPDMRMRRWILPPNIPGMVDLDGKDGSATILVSAANDRLAQHALEKLDVNAIAGGMGLVHIVSTDNPERTLDAVYTMARRVGRDDEVFWLDLRTNAESGKAANEWYPFIGLKKKVITDIVASVIKGPLAPLLYNSEMPEGMLKAEAFIKALIPVLATLREKTDLPCTDMRDVCGIAKKSLIGFSPKLIASYLIPSMAVALAYPIRAKKGKGEGPFIGEYASGPEECDMVRKIVPEELLSRYRAALADIGYDPSDTGIMGYEKFRDRFSVLRSFFHSFLAVLPMLRQNGVGEICIASCLKMRRILVVTVDEGELSDEAKMLLGLFWHTLAYALRGGCLESEDGYASAISSANKNEITFMLSSDRPVPSLFSKIAFSYRNERFLKNVTYPLPSAMQHMLLAQTGDEDSSAMELSFCRRYTGEIPKFMRHEIVPGIARKQGDEIPKETAKKDAEVLVRKALCSLSDKEFYACFRNIPDKEFYAYLHDNGTIPAKEQAYCISGKLSPDTMDIRPGCWKTPRSVEDNEPWRNRQARSREYDNELMRLDAAILERLRADGEA